MFTPKNPTNFIRACVIFNTVCTFYTIKTLIGDKL